MPPVRTHYEPGHPELWPDVIPTFPLPDERVEHYYPNPEFERYPQPTRQFPYQQHFPIATPLGEHQLEASGYEPLRDDPAPLLPQNNPMIPDMMEQINPGYWNPQWAGPYTPGPGFPQDKYGRPPWMGGTLPGPAHPGWEEHSPWSKRNSNPHTPNNPPPFKQPPGRHNPPLETPRKRLPNKDPLEGALMGGLR